MLRVTLDTLGEIFVLIKFSPKREKQYEKVQKNVEFASFHNAAEVIKQKLLNCMTACLHCLISALRRGSYQLM